MSDNNSPLMLEFVRRLGAKVDALTGEVRDLRHRMARVERRLAALDATEALHHATIMVRLDRLAARLDRMEDHPDAADPADEA
jgi:hypothetical protein